MIHTVEQKMLERPEDKEENRTDAKNYQMTSLKARIP